ncbi:uncharacterized protein VNE69_11047 [Vairimorpha necatrix]|uniref:Uncharacterized protein n=1 Tax=Vairimorpha necatrix TaxID=6039 RepID=A0AAX4JFW5_9MICR
MNIYRIFHVFLFAQGFQHVYDKLNTLINNKIKNKEYWEIDTEKIYLKAKLSFDSTNNQLIGFFIKKSFNSTIEEQVNRIRVDCDGRLIQNIIEEFELKVLHEYEKFNIDYIVIIYESKYCAFNLFDQIINFLRTTNMDRKKNIYCSNIIYEYIIHDNIFWNQIFVNIFVQNSNYEMNKKKILLTYSKRNNMRYINFCINFSNFYYFFEINVEEIVKQEIYSQINVKTAMKNEFDEEIKRNLYTLYEDVDLDNLERHYSPSFVACTADKIKFRHSKLEIVLGTNSILFAQKYNNYVHSQRNIANQLGNRSTDEDKFLKKFKKLFEKITEINTVVEHCKGVEMFFMSIECGNVLDFLLCKILNDADLPFYVLLGHILFCNELITENELKKIIRSEGLNVFERIQICKKLKQILSTDNCRSSTFIIKICLFIEAEKYINDNNIESFLQFKILNRIGNLIKRKENSQSYFKRIKAMLTIKKNEIDLIKIYQEVVRYHLKDIKNCKKSVWKEIFSIASLFTRLENNEYIINNTKYNTVLNDVLCSLNLDKNIVEINNEIIRRKLFENTRKRKVMEETKIILQKLNEKYLDRKLNNLKHEALNKKSRIYMMRRGTIIIEKIFNYEKIKKDLAEKFDAFWNKEFKINEQLKFYHEIKNIYYWIEEYKTIEKEKFRFEIKSNINQNILNNNEHYIIEVLEALFESEILNESLMREKCKKYLKDIQMIIDKKNVLEPLNDISKKKLHDLLINTLKARILQ